MKTSSISKRAMVVFAGILLVLSLTINLGLIFAVPSSEPVPRGKPSAPVAGSRARRGDEELAYLLVKLMLRTRREILGHFTRDQSPVPIVDKLYQRLLVKNMVLPAAVADRVFAETVPDATGGRAWVKMVVDQPRNPNNRGDAVALELLEELRTREATAERKTADAYYYAEPIRAQAVCLFCHGEPKGAPDPYFPQFAKEGWHDGEIIGAVVARVAPEGRGGD